MKKMLALSLVLVAIMVAGFNLSVVNNSKKTNEEKASATVKVVNLSQRSGGTGVILSSGNMSHVLTNNHVCEVVKHGGYVVLDNETKYSVVSYKQSNLHDLCLISVAADLKITTSVAVNHPSLYSEAVVAGHPSLLPTILTKGHFSGKILGAIAIGRKKCDASITDPNEALLCLLMGGLPIIKNFEMQVVSATIQPGSSGSAVYDANGDIAGLVFAGSGEIGYGLIVPHEYIVNFLQNELSRLDEKTPAGPEDTEDNSQNSRIRDICRTSTTPILIPICNLINRSTLYVE